MFKQGKVKRLKLRPMEHLVLVDYKVSIDKQGFSDMNRYRVTTSDGWASYTEYFNNLKEAMIMYNLRRKGIL